MKKKSASSVCIKLFIISVYFALAVSNAQQTDPRSQSTVDHALSPNETEHCNSNKHKKYTQAMDEYLTTKMTQSQAAGLTIVVVNGEKVIYQKGFGSANKKNNIAVTSSTLFHIGSVTKLFTGIAIMQLVQKGLIDIDAPLQRYIPEFSVKSHYNTTQPITIRSIMAHQSGLFCDKLSYLLSTQYPAEDFRQFPEFAHNEYTVFPPNHMTSYSNFGVSLLGIVIERVTHQKYEEYIRKNLLKPCGMYLSSFDPKKDHEHLLAQGYEPDGTEAPYYYISENPAGMLASNSIEMARFIQMILKNGIYKKQRILRPFILNSMYTLQNRDLPLDLHDEYASGYNFGLSWIVESKSFEYLGTVVGHGGYLPPYSTSLLIALNQRIGVFASSNSNTIAVDEVAQHALVQAAKILKHIEKPQLPDPAPVCHISQSEQERVIGGYATTYFGAIELFEKNDSLYFQTRSSAPIPLIYHSDGWFSLKEGESIVPGLRFGVTTINGEKTFNVEIRSTYVINRMIIGNAIDFEKSTAQNWEKRFGVYSDMMSMVPTMKIGIDSLPQSKKPFFGAVSNDNGSINSHVINSFNDEEFIFQGLGRGSQETVYTRGDTLCYLGSRLLKISDALPSSRVAPAAVEKQPSTAKDIVAEIHEKFVNRRW